MKKFFKYIFILIVLLSLFGCKTVNKQEQLYNVLSTAYNNNNIEEFNKSFLNVVEYCLENDKYEFYENHTIEEFKLLDKSFIKDYYEFLNNYFTSHDVNKLKETCKKFIDASYIIEDVKLTSKYIENIKYLYVVSNNEDYYISIHDDLVKDESLTFYDRYYPFVYQKDVKYTHVNIDNIKSKYELHEGYFYLYNRSNTDLTVIETETIEKYSINNIGLIYLKDNDLIYLDTELQKRTIIHLENIKQYFYQDGFVYYRDKRNIYRYDIKTNENELLYESKNSDIRVFGLQNSDINNLEFLLEEDLSTWHVYNIETKEETTWFDWNSLSDGSEGTDLE